MLAPGKDCAMDPVTMESFTDELDKLGGVFDRIIKGVGDLTRGGSFVGGVAAGGPSEGFKKWQAAQEALKKAPKPPVHPPMPGVRP